MFCFQFCFGNPDVRQPRFPDGQWSTGLFDCCDNPSNCLITVFCPCVTRGKIIEIVDQGVTSSGQGCLLAFAMSAICCGWQYGSLYRSKLRKLFSLPESPCSDVLIHCFCCACGTCQEYRELKNRSDHPSINQQDNIILPNPSPSRSVNSVTYGSTHPKDPEDSEYQNVFANARASTSRQVNTPSIRFKDWDEIVEWRGKGVKEPPTVALKMAR